MPLLVVGLICFLGVHLLPTLPRLRTAAVAAMSEPRYKGAFSFISLAGLALSIVGYAMADHRARLFAPAPLAMAIAPYAVPVAFVLFAAANMRTHIRRFLGHPMLLGLMIWSAVHLFANGDVPGTLLFGSFLAYSIIDLASAVQRHAVKSFVPTVRHDVISIVAGVALAAIVMLLHRVLFGGVKVVPFGI